MLDSRVGVERVVPKCVGWVRPHWRSIRRRAVGVVDG